VAGLVTTPIMAIGKPLSFNRGAIAATEAIIDQMGEDCRYSPINGERVTITAVIELSTEEAEGENGDFIVSNGRMQAKTSDMPLAVEDDLLAVNTNTEAAPLWIDYLVMEPTPDGLGVTQAWLRKP